jgi:hypothetical protein
MERSKCGSILLLLVLLVVPALVFLVTPASSSGVRKKVSKNSFPSVKHNEFTEGDDTGEAKNNNKDDDNDGCGKQSDRIRFAVPLPGIQSAIWPDGSVSMAIPLQNTSDSLAGGVADRLRIEPIPLNHASSCGTGPWVFSAAALEFQR